MFNRALSTVAEETILTKEAGPLGLLDNDRRKQGRGNPRRRRRLTDRFWPVGIELLGKVLPTDMPELRGTRTGGWTDRNLIGEGCRLWRKVVEGEHQRGGGGMGSSAVKIES
jgi:hypothetical protein